MKEKHIETVFSEEEFRKSGAERLITFFDKTDFFEKIQKLLTADNLKDVFSFEEFRDAIIRINGILRDIPIHDRDADGEHAALGSNFSDIIYRLPLQHDKEDLLLQTYEALPDIQKEDLQYFIPLMITGIHLFNDGNGRTSRVFHVLLKNLISKEDFYFELNKALDINGRNNTMDINSTSINTYLKNCILKKYGLDEWDLLPTMSKHDIESDIDFTLEIKNYKNESADDFFETCQSDSKLALISALEFLKDKDALLNQCLEQKKSGKKYISIKLMDTFLSKDDWKNILTNYFILKKEMCALLIDMFVNPREYMVDSQTTLKEEFIGSLHSDF